MKIWRKREMRTKRERDVKTVSQKEGKKEK
jgi:hypothetical protein